MLNINFFCPSTATLYRRKPSWRSFDGAVERIQVCQEAGEDNWWEMVSRYLKSSFVSFISHFQMVRKAQTHLRKKYDEKRKIKELIQVILCAVSAMTCCFLC